MALSKFTEMKVTLKVNSVCGMIFLSSAGCLLNIHGSGPARHAPLHVDPPGDQGKDSRAGLCDVI